MFFDNWSVVLRTVVVGGLAYLILVLLLRVSGKRTLAKWSAFDLVVTVAFGSTLATALLSKEVKLVQGVVAFVLLVALQWLINALALRSTRVRHWVEAPPTLVLFRGRLLREAMRRERVAEGDLHAALRAHGITAVEEVEAVVLETDGNFSVIRQAGASSSALRDVQGFDAAERGE